MSSIFALTGRVYDAINDEVEVARLAAIADLDADQAKRIEAIGRLAKAGRFPPIGWKSSALTNTAPVVPTAPALCITCDCQPGATSKCGPRCLRFFVAMPNPESSSGRTPDFGAGGEGSSPSSGTTTDGVAQLDRARQGEQPEAPPAPATEVAGSSPAPVPPCKSAAGEFARHRFKGELHCQRCGAVQTRPDRVADHGQGSTTDSAVADGEQRAPAAVESADAGSTPAPSPLPFTRAMLDSTLGAFGVALKALDAAAALVPGVVVSVPSADLVAPDYTNRANYIGSGSIAALVGASKRMGPMDVYLSHVLPVAEEGEEAEWLRLGRLLQPVIAGEVCRRLNLNQSALDEYEVFDPARPHLRAHLDNFAYAISNGINNDDDNDGGRIIIESKATGPWAAEWTGLEEHECASSAFVQVTFQRALAERCEPGAWSKRMVVARFLNLGVRVYELEYDAELGELLLDAAHDFWVNHICAKVPPPLEGPSGSEYLKRRYPRANGHMRPADEGERLFVAAYRSARDEAKRAAEFAAGLRLKVEACIGDADGLEGLATWKASGESVAWKRVAEELARMTYEGQEGAETKAANLLRGTAFLHSKKKGRTLRLIGEKEDSE